MTTSTRRHWRPIRRRRATGLFRFDSEGRLSRNLLAAWDSPDAWVLITGTWAGLSVAGSAAGDPTSGLRTAEPWTPRRAS